jgi:hypothetical protein
MRRHDAHDHGGRHGTGGRRETRLSPWRNTQGIFARNLFQQRQEQRNQWLNEIVIYLVQARYVAQNATKCRGSSAIIGGGCCTIGAFARAFVRQPRHGRRGQGAKPGRNKATNVIDRHVPEHVVLDPHGRDLHAGINGRTNGTSERIPHHVIKPGAKLVPTVFVQVLSM